MVKARLHQWSLDGPPHRDEPLPSKQDMSSQQQQQTQSHDDDDGIREEARSSSESAEAFFAGFDWILSSLGLISSPVRSIITVCPYWVRRSNRPCNTHSLTLSLSLSVDLPYESQIRKREDKGLWWRSNFNDDIAPGHQQSHGLFPLQ